MRRPRHKGVKYLQSLPVAKGELFSQSHDARAAGRPAQEKALKFFLPPPAPLTGFRIPIHCQVPNPFNEFTRQRPKRLYKKHTGSLYLNNLVKAALASPLNPTFVFVWVRVLSGNSKGKLKGF